MSIPEVTYKSILDQQLELEIVSFDQLKKVLKKVTDHDPFKAHRLKFNVLLVVGRGGSGVHQIDFKGHSFQERSTILISKDQIQTFVDLPEDNEGFLLMFTEKLFLEVGGEYPFLIDHFFNNQLYDPIHNLNENDFSELESMISKMKSKFEDKRKSVRMEVVKAYFKILLLEIFACRERKYEKVHKSPHTKYFLEFQQLLKAHFVREKKVKFYADKLNITVKKLNQITQAVVNQSAKDFILAYILLEAKKLLITPDLSSKEVAYGIGFDEPTNFTKFFKTHTNILPSKFTESILSN